VQRDALQFLTIAAADGTRFIDLAIGRSLEYRRGSERALAVHPGRQLFAAASTIDPARVYDVASSRPAASPPRNQGVRAMAFSPDGSCLATGSDTRELNVWDFGLLANIKPARPVERTRRGRFRSPALRLRAELDHWVLAVASSPDSRYVAAGVSAGTAHVWELSSGLELARVTGDTGVPAVAFSPDGTTLWTARADGEIHGQLWRPADLIAEAERRAERRLSREEWRSAVGDDEPYPHLAANQTGSAKRR
jgi:WD40 repeat protein